jgi:hypothetical protein
MKLFRYKDSCLRAGALTALAALALPAMVQAQYFDYTSGGSGQGAVLAGFRKVGGANNEFVAKVGNILDLRALPVGTTTNLGNYSSQLTTAFSGTGNLRWSVSATFTGPFGFTWNGYKLNTVWFTVPRADPAIQTAAPARGGSGQSFAVNAIDSIGKGGNTISQQVGTTGANNNTNLVVEPTPNTSAYGNFVSDGVDPNSSRLNNGVSVNIENTTPASFTSAVRSDLYQSVPTGSTDPNLGTTTGAACYVGYFTLNPDGTLTFTRDLRTPSIVNKSRAGNTMTVTFTTVTNSPALTYSLRYTNSAGLTAPISTWAVSPTTVAGDGANHQLSDTTTDSDRFYRVSVHQ